MRFLHREGREGGHLIYAASKDGPMKKPAPQEFLNTGEIASQFGVCEETIRREIRKGLLKSVRIGRAFRVNRHDLDAYLNRK